MQETLDFQVWFFPQWEEYVLRNEGLFGSDGQ